MASELSEEEKQLAKQFIESVNEERKGTPDGPLAWEDGVKFLMARKFDLERAKELHKNYQQTIYQERLNDINPCNEILAKELLSGKLTILSSRDREGAAIALFTARLHNPLTSPQHVTLQALFWQLDTALNSLETQRNGLVFMYDMTGSKLSNFSYDLSDRILRLLKGAFPARLKKVVIILPPLWFKIPFKILSFFIREKLKDRVYTVDDGELGQLVAPSALPTHLGGTATIDHAGWLAWCLHNRGVPDTLSNKFFALAPAASGLLPSQKQPITTAAKLPVSSSAPVHSLTSTPSVYMMASSDSFPAPQLGQQLMSNDVRLNGDGQKDHLIDGDVPSATIKKRAPEVSPEASEPLKKHLSSELAFGGDSGDVYNSVHGADAKGLTPQQLIARVKQLRRQGLFQEYASIKSEPPAGSFNAAKDKANIGKNRYTDVLCYDHSRVVLEREGEDPSSDFINANFADGYKHKQAYICTMGPTPKTFNDFWRMVWQEHVRTIVMTTKTAEKGKVKCGQYWPVTGDLPTGSFIIVNMGSQSKGDYDVSTLQITHAKSGYTRTVKHFLFLSWPDYGIPSTPAAFLRFLHDVRETQANSTGLLGKSWQGHPEGPPIVTHCSAGIGRTGTFLTIDICLKQLVDTGTANISETVRKIRTQRAFSIQMPDQYLFCHLAVIEYAKSFQVVVSSEDLSPYVAASDDSS